MPTLQQSTQTTDTNSFGVNSELDAYTPRSITHVAKFKPHSIVVYKKFEGFERSKTQNELKNLEKGTAGDYNGYLSPQTSRQIKSMLENWLMCLEWNITRGWTMTMEQAMKDKKVRQEFAPTFVTLTLPATQKQDDNFIKRSMLWRFIQQMQRKYFVKYYFWRAEPQANGNIHFHILVDKWINWRRVRDEWNKILDDNGYIEDYRNNQLETHKNGFQVDKKQLSFYLNKCRESAKASGNEYNYAKSKEEGIKRQKNAYEIGLTTNFSSPNSTDIHAIAKLNSITAYVVKYVCKDKDHKTNKIQVSEIDENGNEVIKDVSSIRKIGGRIWGCSDELRNLKHYEETIAEEIDFNTYTYDNEAFEAVKDLQYSLPKKDVVHDIDAGLLILMLRSTKIYEYLRDNNDKMFKKYSNHYCYSYNYLYKPEIICNLFEVMLQLIEISNKFTIAKKSDELREEVEEEKKENLWFQPTLFDIDCPF